MRTALRNLFAESGRLGRKAYWTGLFLALCAVGAFFGIALRGQFDDTAADILFLLVQAVLAWLAGRRFKDLGLSPLWARIPVAAGAICAVSAIAVDDWNEISDAQQAIKLTLLLFYVFAPLLLVLLAGLPRGSAGHNRYGPPPNERKTLDEVPKLFE